MKSTILTLALALSLLGCGTSSSGSSGGGNAPDKKKETNGGGGVGPAGTYENITDYSGCNEGPAAHSIEGSWSQELKDGELHMFSMLSIERGVATVTNTCNVGSRALRVVAAAPARYTQNIFEVLGKGEEVKNIDENGFKMSCFAQIQPYILNYSFKGSCLVFSDPKSGQSITFLPVHP